MPDYDPGVRHALASLAIATRHHRDDTELLARLRREVDDAKAAAVDSTVAAVVARANRLTPEQRAQLAALLSGPAT